MPTPTDLSGKVFAAVSSLSGKCLFVVGSSVTDGASISQASCTDLPSQQWMLVRSVKGGYQLVVQSSGKCLDVNLGSLAEGQILVQNACASDVRPSQRWQVRASVTGFALVAYHSGKCADIYARSSLDNAKIIQAQCVASVSQTWYLRELPTANTATDGPTIMFKSLWSSKCLQPDSVASSGNVLMVQRLCTGTPEQQWKLQAAARFYRIAVDATHCLADAGAAINGYDLVAEQICNGSTSQLWQIALQSATDPGSKNLGTGLNGINAPTQFVLTNVNSSLCLQPDGASDLDGARVTLAACSQFATQQWEISVLRNRAVTATSGNSFGGLVRNFTVGMYDANRGQIADTIFAGIGSLVVPDGMTAVLCTAAPGSLFGSLEGSFLINKGSLGPCRYYKAGQYSSIDMDFPNGVGMLVVSAGRGLGPALQAISTNGRGQLLASGSIYELSRGDIASDIGALKLAPGQRVLVCTNDGGSSPGDLTSSGPCRYFEDGNSLASDLAQHVALIAVYDGLNSPARPDVTGAFGPVLQWPLIPIHVALTPSGRVMSYGSNLNGTQSGRFYYDIWNPTSGKHLVLPNTTQTDIFCSAQVIIPSTGDLLIAGGDQDNPKYINKPSVSGTTGNGNPDGNVFSDISNALNPTTGMHYARWYGSVSTLPDGRTLIMGGRDQNSSPTLVPEIYTSSSGWSLLPNAITPDGIASHSPFVNGWFYPRTFVMSDGNVLVFTSVDALYIMNPNNQGGIAKISGYVGASRGTYSSSVLLSSGTFLLLGGGSYGDATNEAAIFNFSTPSNITVQMLQPMKLAREWVTATTLPDGRVLASGGGRADNFYAGIARNVEIWDAKTGLWSLGAAGANARLYHSVALLLPDATVLIGGGGAPGPEAHEDAEIYYPPYLFDASGNRLDQPVITSAPAVTSWGQSYSITYNSSRPVQRATLVRLGSVTHSVNFDQRFLELTFSAGSHTGSMMMPASANLAPPGYYMLFLLNDLGVPSVASIVKISS